MPTTRKRRSAGRSGPLTGPARGPQAAPVPALKPIRTYAGPWRTRATAGRSILAGHAPRGASRPQNPQPTGPLGGSGAAAPHGALRAIDSTARPRLLRLLADLRSAPPAAASQA